MTKNTNNNTITLKEVETTARQAALATLKRIYCASGEQKIYQLYLGLIQDFNTIDNNKTNNITDGYDLFLTAYSYLLEQYNNNKSMDDIITISLKNGTTKDLTVFQNACRLVRQEIYKHSDNNKSNYLYINDFSQVDEDGNIEQFADTCDRLIRVNKYYNIDNYEDYNTTTEMLQNITLSKRDRDILNKRLQGVSVSEIADIYGVSHQAISKALARIQKATADKYPEKIRQFKAKRIYK
ncbi:MAG: hypothetical protein II220_04710 [Spirochaetales bacterium]|nr:hypothetical protein [Spirochaetales bacterium]